MMAAATTETTDVPCCPICLEQFNIPRQLPCAHSFCEKCLQSHITEGINYAKLSYIKCPVCRNSASPSIKDRLASEWASLFPVNTVLQSVLPAKSKVDSLCDACNTGDSSVPAEGFCMVCKQAMCRDCLKVHSKLKVSKDHAILRVDELACNPENVMKLAEGFTCSEHHGEDIKYYCKDHNVAGCGSCFFEGHKMCSKVINLKNELPALLCDSKPNEIIADMKKIEIHLKKFMEINDSSVSTIETQIDRMTDQIREVRKNINSVLDELEKQIKTEGSRIYKEEVIKKQDENHQCLSLLHAVRNSHYLLETVHKYGSNLQTFLMVETMRSQLCFYYNLVREKYEKTETVSAQVEFSPIIQSILSVSLSELGKVETTTSTNNLTLTCCQIERVDVIDLKVPSGNRPLYSGVTFLPGDKVMLADFDSNQCILLSPSYQFITSHALTDKPWNVCVLDDQEVAVSSYNQNTIQILSVIGDVIRPVRTITTNYSCSGIASAGKGEMIVNGNCGNSKSQWSLINTKGDVKYSHQYDSPYCKDNYVALNNMKTRVYVTVYDMSSLLCFDMDGRKHFTYSHASLNGPYGVDVDKYNNIYVLGYWSHNIHQLSPNGSVLHVIASGVPRTPCAICIHKSKDMLIFTNVSDRRKLCIYQLK